MEVNAVLLESALESSLKAKIKRAGGLCYKFTSPGTAGVPDRLIILNGRILFAELKRPDGKGRLSPIQKARIAEMRRCGAQVYVVDSQEAVDDIIRICTS